MDNITVTLVFIPNNLALQFNPDARRKRIYTWHNDPWVNGWLRENIGHEVMYIGDEVADHYDLTPSLISMLWVRSSVFQTESFSIS